MRDRRLRQLGRAVAVALLVSAAAPAARATPITYLLSGTGSGTVDGTPFTEAAYVIRAVGDTADVTIISGFPLPGSVATAPVTASMEIAGVGTATLTGAATLTNVSPDATLSLTVGSPTPMLRGADLGLLGYEMQSAFGPLVLTGAPFLSQVGQPSDLGPITLDSSSAITFEAVATCAAAAPATGCLAAAKSALLLASTGVPATALLGWRWAGGPPLALADFADPTGDADYTLCVYGGATNTLIAEAELPAGSRWSSAGARGYRYRDRASGTVARLRSGGASTSSAVVKSRRVDLRQAFPFSAPIVVQLHKAGGSLCLESRFDAPRRSDATKLKAREP